MQPNVQNPVLIYAYIYLCIYIPLFPAAFPWCEQATLEDLNLPQGDVAEAIKVLQDNRCDLVQTDRPISVIWCMRTDTCDLLVLRLLVCNYTVKKCDLVFKRMCLCMCVCATCQQACYFACAQECFCI